MSSGGTQITKRTVTRTVKSSGDDDVSETTTNFQHTNRNYQVYRGMSPTTANRIEIRMKELEDALEQERAAHTRTQKTVNELHIQITVLHEELHQSSESSSSQSQLGLRREQEVAAIRKEMELLIAQHDANEASLRKRHQDAIKDLNEQLEKVNKNKTKIGLEKQQLILEMENCNAQADSANKAKAYVEGKMDELEAVIRRLKVQVEDLTRNNQELSSIKIRLGKENDDYQHQVKDLESRVNSLTTVKTNLDSQLESVRSKVEDQKTYITQVDVQYHSLQSDFDKLHNQLDEEVETSDSLRAQLQQTQADYQQVKAKYDADFSKYMEREEESRRKLTIRISELELSEEQWRLKANKLEKEKLKLSVEINEVKISTTEINISLEDSTKRLRQSESLNSELQRRVTDLSHEMMTGSSDNTRISTELARIKVVVNDQQAKIDQLTRENAKFNEAVRDSDSALKNLTRQLQEVSNARADLQVERDGLLVELANAKDHIQDLEQRLNTANNSLGHSRTEIEHRIREKDEEIENTRKASQRTIEELHRTIVELELKGKSEATRFKKKFDTETHELEIQVDLFSQNNNELLKANKSLSNKLKETEVSLEGDRLSLLKLRETLTTLEKKLISVQTESDETRGLFDAAEKGRKKAEFELSESRSTLNDINITITNITSDKRRLEGDVQVFQHQLNDALSSRKASEDRAEKLEREVVRIAEQLRQQTEDHVKVESVKKQLDVQVRELTIRLEESSNVKDSKRVSKLQAELADLEMERDAEARHGRKVTAENTKLQRQLLDLRSQVTADRKLVVEYTETINVLQSRVVNYKSQLEKTEEVLSITMNKYRKTQQDFENAQHRADRAERNINSVVNVRHVTTNIGLGGGRQRAMSVSRETTRLVRV